MAIGIGSNKQIRIKRQSVKGTLAGVTLGQIVRREEGTFTLAKEAYTTESEKTSTRQLKSSRHGGKIVNGRLSGLWSPGTYSDPLQALLMRDFAAVAASTGMSITIAGTGPSYTITRAAGSWLTDAVKIGMIGRLSAGTFNANNLLKNILVVGVTALVLTVMLLNADLTLTAEGPIAGSTFTVIGKVTYVPMTGHTNFYYTVEVWQPDIPNSERSLDVKWTQATCSIPGTGNCKIDFSATGLNQTRDPAVYFTAPTAETSSETAISASGILMVNGTAQGIITDLSFTIDGKAAPADLVVGSNIRPDVFMGKVMITGSFTGYHDGNTIPDLFNNETSTSILAVIASGSAANADFISIFLPKVDLNSSDSDDAETGMKRTYSFVAELNSAGGAGMATEATSIQVQDSLAA